MGEKPTIHPQFLEILEYLDKFNVRKYFCTNGMLLGDIKDSIFNNNVDIIAVSLDSPNKEKNDSIRRRADFDKIINNIKALKEKSVKKGLDYPYINFATTLMKDNLNELPDIVQLTYDIKIEEAKVVYLTVFSQDLVESSLYDCSEEVEEVFERSIKLAEKLGIDLKLPHIQGKDSAGDKYHQDCFVVGRIYSVVLMVIYDLVCQHQ